MKKVSIVLAVTAAFLIVGAAKIAIGQEKGAKTVKPVYVSSESASYTEKMPGVSMAVIWGDPDKGAHATFTKFTPGYDAGMHSHTNDVSIVVLKGAYLYKDDQGDKRVGAGEFLRVPGGHKHWSGGDKTDGALFYEEGAAKFDVVPAK